MRSKLCWLLPWLHTLLLQLNVLNQGGRSLNKCKEPKMAQ